MHPRPLYPCRVSSWSISSLWFSAQSRLSSRSGAAALMKDIILYLRSIQPSRVGPSSTIGHGTPSTLWSFLGVNLIAALSRRRPVVLFPHPTLRQPQPPKSTKKRKNITKNKKKKEKKKANRHLGPPRARVMPRPLPLYS